MPHASGLIYRDGSFFEGHVNFTEDGQCEVGEGQKGGATHTGIILPRFINCHTHLGDSAVTKPEKGTIDEIVAPPDGYKHRMLKKLTADEQIHAMHHTMEKMAESGTSHTLDFREGGLEGVSRLLSSAVGANVRPIVFGRPETLGYDKTEIDRILAVVDGIGLSALSDWHSEDLRKISRQAENAGKPFALHASERVREDIEEIISLNPAFLVHMIEATQEDLCMCAEKEIPIVICPSANKFFGIRPPVEKMVEAGINICLGTDNAMLAEPDIFVEMRALRELTPPEVLSDLDIIKVVFENSRKVLKSISDLGVEYLRDNGFIVLQCPLDNPVVRVLDASKNDICYIWRGGMK